MLPELFNLGACCRITTERGKYEAAEAMGFMLRLLRQGGYIPFFVTERKRSEAALIQVIQEAFVQGVSTRKMEK